MLFGECWETVAIASVIIPLTVATMSELIRHLEKAPLSPFLQYVGIN
jgi:hypothetical protein